MKSHRILLGMLVLGTVLGISNLTTAPGAPQSEHHQSRTVVAFKTPPGGTTIPVGRVRQLVASIDVSSYSHIRIAAHAETFMVLYASVVQDGEEIAQLLPGYPVGPIGSTTNSGAFTLDFAVPGQELQIKAENDDLADGRLSLVVYGRE
jgi:hypothetical protein